MRSDDCLYLCIEGKKISFTVGCGSADGAFEGQGKEFLGFDGEFHGEFGHDLFGVAVDNQPDGFFGRNSALVAVEELVGRDF